MTFSSHLACIKNKVLQLKDQVQLMKLVIIRKDVARPSAQLAVVLLLNIQWVLIKHLWCYQVKKLISSPVCTIMHVCIMSTKSGLIKSLIVDAVFIVA